MDLSQFGQQNQPQQYYQTQPHQPSRKKLLLVIGGIIILLIALVLVVFSGRTKPGQEEMRRSLQAMSESVGVLDEYEPKLQLANTKNDVALMKIILRGNYQKLNELYNKTYKPRNKFSQSPKPDDQATEELDAATRNNTLDSEIFSVLDEKITDSAKYLKQARPNFGKKESVESINKSLEDFTSIEDLLNKAR